MIRLMLADHHTILRSGLRRLMAAQPDMEIVAEAADAKEAISAVVEYSPDVAVIGLDMPQGGGIWAISETRRRLLPTQMLVLTRHDDLAYLRASLAAGAAGYLVKSATDTDLLKAIRTISQGRTYVDVSVSEYSREVVTPVFTADNGSTLEVLSDREKQVLRLVALGYTHREIAEHVQLSIKTIETYRSRIAEKLKLRRRADLVRFALDTGLLERTGGSKA